MRRIGLKNTFIAGYFAPGSPLLARITTPANSRTDVWTDPDPYNQTTPLEMGLLLADLYQCATHGSGSLIAVFPESIDKDICQKMIDFLAEDRIGKLLEAGLPEGTRIAHKHGWVTDVDGVIRNYSDAGLIYTPGGDFVLSVYAYHPVQILDDTANVLFARLASTAYNYYNVPLQP
jgi:beta-lactamase class A